VNAIPDLADVNWPSARRIIRSRFPPIDLFEDIADPADWDLLAAAEARTNPRLSESIGILDLVPVARRVSGPGASWVMAPFVHVSPDRTSRFSDGRFGVFYAGDSFEVALFETIYHHEGFMRATSERPGWSSDFRELACSVTARLHDMRPPGAFSECLDPHDHAAAQALALMLRQQGSDGIVYPSVRYPVGQCVALFWPDVPELPVQGRHLSYHWDGSRVDRVRDINTRDIFAVEA